MEAGGVGSVDSALGWDIIRRESLPEVGAFLSLWRRLFTVPYFCVRSSRTSAGCGYLDKVQLEDDYLILDCGGRFGRRRYTAPVVCFSCLLR